MTSNMEDDYLKMTNPNLLPSQLVELKLGRSPVHFISNQYSISLPPISCRIVSKYCLQVLSPSIGLQVLSPVIVSKYCLQVLSPVIVSKYCLQLLSPSIVSRFFTHLFQIHIYYPSHPSPIIYTLSIVP